MATILENIQKARFLPTRPLRDDLPTFQGGGGGGSKEESHLMGLRKRLSSFSGKIQPISSASAEWAFRRTRSAPSLAAEFAGGPLKRWWDWGLGWLLSKKLGFAGDLEMNEEEAAALGRQSRGTWAHVLYKVRSGVRRLVASDHSLPTSQRLRGASLPPSSAHQHCKPAPQFAYTQSFQYGQAMAH
ncbi:hypothetical protein ACQJBY_058337 [Aegilops geniculata]